MSARRVRPDEIELWSRVARSTDPFESRGKLAPKGPGAKPTVTPDPSEPEPIPAFRLGQGARRADTAMPMPRSTPERLRAEPKAMDAKAFQRMKRGKLVPEARLDLHGMTLDRAHAALGRFIRDAQGRGLRLVLVITGKGQREDPYDPVPQRRGVLKTQVPQWLRMAPLGPLVLQISEAHIRHGGGGAYYVYLRRTR